MSQITWDEAIIGPNLLRILGTIQQDQRDHDAEAISGMRALVCWCAAADGLDITADEAAALVTKAMGGATA